MDTLKENRIYLSRFLDQKPTKDEILDYCDILMKEVQKGERNVQEESA